MQVLANEVKADKKALVAQNMELTATEAEFFWPIYDAYQQDLQKINDRMSLTILEYADASSKGTVDDATAKKLLGKKRWRSRSSNCSSCKPTSRSSRRCSRKSRLPDTSRSRARFALWCATRRPPIFLWWSDAIAHQEATRPAEMR